MNNKRLQIQARRSLAMLVFLVACSPSINLATEPTSLPVSTSTQPLPTITATLSSPSLPRLIADPYRDDMVLVPAGDFEMGSESGDFDESPVHTVYLDDFYIDLHETSNLQFSRFVEERGHQTAAEVDGDSWVYSEGDWVEMDGADWQHPLGPNSSIRTMQDHPVVHVSWDDASAYCEWRGARLTTEAEWEKAARGKDGRVYPWGDQSVDGNLANFADRNTEFIWSDDSADDGYSQTAPVGSYPDGASPYGLLDMAGNVWEWVADWWDGDYYREQSSQTENPRGPRSGTQRGMRGGSSFNGAYLLRAANRNFGHLDLTGQSFGFRCASSP